LRSVKLVFAAVLLFVGSLGGAVPSARAAAVSAAEFAGQRYFLLSDWAHANGFDARWLERGESFSVTNRSFRLLFQKDSKNAQFNDINVLLSYPIVVHSDAAYIAETDLRLTLAPLLSPPTGPTGTRIKTIVIDPGHGGRDPGFQVGANQEKKYTLLLAKELRDQLKKAGFNASLTRTSDTYVEKAARPDIARQRGADLFISLHWNSAGAGGDGVQGVQTYCVTPAGAPSSNESSDITDTSMQPGNRNNDKSLFLAYTLQRSLVQGVGINDRGVRRARFTVLCLAQMPAILIEGGYMSNPAESKRIYDPAYRRQMAHAIVNGVLAYKHQLEPPSDRAPASPSSSKVH
jgi:N-acetylmuramoyl-L-alanine amidase